MTTLTTASDKSYLLGEGPLWDSVRSRLLWVDIRNGTVFSGRLRLDDTIQTVESFTLSETVGAVAVSANGELLIAGRERLYLRSADGDLRAGPTIVPAFSGRRLNDGKTDPVGRYLVGTLCLNGSSTSESLVGVDLDGTRYVIDDDLTLSNGLAWTADGETLYSVDTERRVIFVRTYDAVSGQTGARDVFLTIDEGYPDGMTIDAEDHLWVAIWGLGQVRRYSPAAKLVQTIHVPAPHTSSVAFAGADLETLVITTAAQDLDPQQLAAYPLSGRIFTTRPGVRGLPQPLWNASQFPTH